MFSAVEQATFWPVCVTCGSVLMGNRDVLRHIVDAIFDFNTLWDNQWLAWVKTNPQKTYKQASYYSDSGGAYSSLYISVTSNRTSNLQWVAENKSFSNTINGLEGYGH